LIRSWKLMRSLEMLPERKLSRLLLEIKGVYMI
jgi:hypothetical protein